MLPRPVSFLLLLLLTALPLEAAHSPSVDSYGDPLPEYALARLGTGRFQPGTWVNSLAYSPDGKLLASAGSDRIISLWDAQSVQKLRQFKGHSGGVQALAFSPDSICLVSASNDGPRSDLYLWNVATGKVVFPLLKDQVPIWTVAFAPDGKTIASGHAKNGVRLWDAQTGKMIRQWSFGTPGRSVVSVAFAPNGKMLATAGEDGQIGIFDSSTGKEVTRLAKPAGPLNALAFSPDGTVLAAAGGADIRLYSASNWKALHQLEGHEGAVNALAFSRDSKTLISGANDRTIRWWDVQSGKEVRQVSKFHGWVLSVVVAPDGKMVASASSWEFGGIQLWDATTGAPRHPRQGSVGEVQQVRVLRDGKTVVATVGSGPKDTAQVVVWPHGTGNESRSLELPPGAENCWLCSDRSTLAVATDEGTLFLLDILSGRECARCATGNKMNVVAISADNKRAALKVGRGVEVWDLTTRKVLRRFPQEVWCGDFSPDGRKLVVQIGLKASLSIWDLETDKEAWSLEGEKYLDEQVTKLVFSPDGRLFVTGGYRIPYRLWETATGKERLKVRWPPVDNTGPIAFSPDSKILAMVSVEQTVRLWDMRDGTQLRVMPGHQGKINCLDFSPGGQRVVSGSNDLTAILWEVPTTIRERNPDLAALTRREQDKLWETLAIQDAALAYPAFQRLAAEPTETVALCRARLLEKPATSPEKIQRLIAQLDDEEFTVREQASSDLERVAGEAEEALQSKLKGDCSLEVRYRIKALLGFLKEKSPRSRALRAVEILEQIGTAEAADVLRQLARTTGDAWLREEAQGSLRRLTAKPGAP